MTSWFLYIIRSSDNALYTGITTDIQRRLLQHQSGKGAKSLRGKHDLQLVFSACVGEHARALRAEYRIKQLKKASKEQLVAGSIAFEDLITDLQTHSIKND